MSYVIDVMICGEVADSNLPKCTCSNSKIQSSSYHDDTSFSDTKTLSSHTNYFTSLCRLTNELLMTSFYQTDRLYETEDLITQWNTPLKIKCL